MKPTALAHLIAEFLDAQQDRHRVTWHMADITVTIYEKAGVPGLHDLAAASGLTEGYLRMFIRTARAFPQGVRRTELSFHHHIVAMRALRRFPAGTPEHSPQFWADQAAVQGLTRNALKAAMANHTAAGAALETRQAVAVKRVNDADHERQRILALAEVFNRVHAPFWGSRLVIVEQPILSSAS